MHVVYTENAAKHIEIIQKFIGSILKDNDENPNETIEIGRQNKVYFRSVISLMTCIIKKMHGKSFKTFHNYAVSQYC